jgi:hypothetical protein
MERKREKNNVLKKPPREDFMDEEDDDPEYEVVSRTTHQKIKLLPDRNNTEAEITHIRDAYKDWLTIAFGFETPEEARALYDRITDENYTLTLSRVIIDETPEDEDRKDDEDEAKEDEV